LTWGTEAFFAALRTVFFAVLLRATMAVCSLMET
jgi:hypothetical protein